MYKKKRGEEGDEEETKKGRPRKTERREKEEKNYNTRGKKRPEHHDPRKWNNSIESYDSGDYSTDSPIL
ncbi:MAG: hypothetical protein ACTSUE_09620 [Promethearchaeota archaeon]